MNNIIVGVDLAKNVIQVCIYSNQKVRSNTEMTTSKFTEWLANSAPVMIVFEACGTSNYWKQKALSLGHDARLISPNLVKSIRQNQKTDENDALAIVQASLLPNVTFIAGKSIEQQQLQSMLRLRELCVKQKTASYNQLVALLSEFNIKVSNRNGGLKGTIEAVLEDADNGFSVEFRQALQMACVQFSSIVQSIAVYDTCLENALESHSDCKKLLQLEGVGTLNAINLYIALGCAELSVFKKGKNAKLIDLKSVN
ncbi:transposase IS116/IS110/IS902 family protein [Catenovulum agarivorans DS-2]|uniref:Transposase IS116/IS110/IS902 family protein n=1 Tax=Catenovulum agarivorans DS-2 TaxID=1328313 RepID=W7QIW8_9ALTE|nr:transposase IS116/IS110/IS902 family protein [Catenovulum agarivorans DS-2]